ncbi:lysozyme [Mucilaginibacter koreensis]
MMHLSIAGRQLIKNFEGLRLNAYQDSAGVWTIGYGSTHYTNGSPVKPGDHLTDEQQADHLFAITLFDYEQTVNQLVKVKLTQHQFDALVSFTYNVGTGALQSSTLLKKLNQADYASAANQFLVWNKVTSPKTGRKVISAGLKKRREQERALFLTP